jgi:hypothetical protein
LDIMQAISTTLVAIDSGTGNILLEVDSRVEARTYSQWVPFVSKPAGQMLRHAPFSKL